MHFFKPEIIKHMYPERKIKVISSNYRMSITWQELLEYKLKQVKEQMITIEHINGEVVKVR